MMKQAKPPVDIMKVRKHMNKTREEFGQILALVRSGLGAPPIRGSRIHEWERGYRSVPMEVYQACAGLITDEWAVRRHEAPENRRSEIDVHYGGLLIPAFGKLLGFAHPDPAEQARRERQARRIREAFVHHARMTFGFDISYVWS